MDCRLYSISFSKDAECAACNAIEVALWVIYINSSLSTSPFYTKSFQLST
jgi:hypothetical protein